ncbi:MAG: phosphoglycerate dehydrogenase [Balneolaceae bacterium]|nr:phosphoglycerate dehydrogenase [Balneolaceae bacterium]
MAFKILVLDNVDPVCEEVFRERGMQTVRKTSLDRPALLQAITDYHGIVVRSATTVDREVLEAARSLKVVGRAGVGVDNIDIPAATARGVLVMNTPDGNTVSTAEHTCGMILALSRNIPQAVRRVKEGGWDRKKYMGAEVHGKTLGVVGLGKIGSEVAARMKAFGMKVVAYDPYASVEKAEQAGVELVELEELMGAADVVTVHTPLTDKTRGLFSMENASAFKEGVRLINCARGGIIREEDMVAMIEEGPVAGIAVDVYSEEPPGEEIRRALDHPCIVTTPHLGASTEEAQEKVARHIALQMSDALERKDFKGSLNGKSIALTTNSEVQPYLELAERLGSVTMQLAPEHTDKFSFEYSGTCARYAEVLTDSLLKGMLLQHVSESVNLINARHYAGERGFGIRETTVSRPGTYSDLVTVKLEGAEDYGSISATVFGEGDSRIVDIDGFGIELRLRRDFLIYKNEDRPGMLAAVSGALAARDINIASLSNGRARKGSEAITAVAVDRTLDDGEQQSIRDLDGVRALRYVQL